jgi:hypothetical protein
MDEPKRVEHQPEDGCDLSVRPVAIALATPSPNAVPKR